MANCPFEPLYRARRDLDLAGVHIPEGHEFHWDFRRGWIDTARRFDRSDGWHGGEG
jgi:hypothetical protein